MSRYFVHTKKGQTRASLVVPEPFFVHSDLTTGVQLADLIAYCLSWGLRLKGMEKPRRQELDEFVDQLMDMRHLSKRSVLPTMTGSTISGVSPTLMTSVGSMPETVRYKRKGNAAQ